MAYQTKQSVDENPYIDDEGFFEQEIKEEKKPSFVIFSVYALAGFFFSQLCSLGEMSPFCCAFLCSIPFEYTLPVFFSSVLGYFISHSWQSALKYIAVLALCAFIRLIISKKTLKEKPDTPFCFIAFASILSVNIATLFFVSFDFFSAVTLVCEAVLSLVSAAFFIKSFRIPLGRIGISSLNAKDSACLISSGCIFIMCMSGFTLEGVSPGRIIAALFVMFMSFYKGISAGAIAGICAGISLCIDPNGRYLFACYALGGLVSGLFSCFGQVLSSVLFALSFCSCCVMSISSEGVIINVVECIIASACFMFIPSRWLVNLQDYIEKSGITDDGKINSEVSANLYAAANNIYEVSKIVGSVCERLDSVIGPEVNKLFASLQQSVCTGCESKNKCWNKMFNSTAKDVMAIAGIEPRGKNRLPIEKRCTRIDTLTKQIEASYSDYVNSMAVKMKIREMRKVLTDQFAGIGDFLFEIADKISVSRVLDPARSTSMRTALNDSGIYTDALSYFTSSDGRITVEVTFVDRALDIDCKKMKTIIEFMTKRRFEKPQMSVSDIRTRVVFEEKAYYKVETGFFQKPMVGGALCGDSVSIVDGLDGTQNAIISDGMGTGSRAAIDSTMTCSIMEKLISSGFSFSSALKIVNSAMIMKSTDESMSTIDAVSVNVYNGKASFYKAGAAISFLRRDKEVFIIQMQSLPIGIIRNISFASESIELETGDIILLVSDGVTTEDCGWINDELLAWSTNNMQDLAKHIVNLATLRGDESTRDDLTAVAVKVTRNKSSQ